MQQMTGPLPEAHIAALVKYLRAPLKGATEREVVFQSNGYFANSCVGTGDCIYRR